jgi:predicted dehydrogenase
MRAVAENGASEIVAVSDQNTDAAQNALQQIIHQTPTAQPKTFDALIDSELDGVVIATPNAEHPSQTRAALEAGCAVFCQKPLALSYPEALSLVETARRADRLLAVDYSYRHVAGVPEMKRLLNSSELGEIYAIDLIFHNAYGPDKPWFYDVKQAGGGCVIDLGIHLIDLLLWTLAYPRIDAISSTLYRGGSLLQGVPTEPEDYASAEIHLATGAIARLACSWRLPAGCDAVIEASFYGTHGAVRLRNVQGSFYDFQVDHCERTQCKALGAPSTDWGGVAIRNWARQVGTRRGFDPSIQRDIEVHRIIDAIYRR